MTNRDGFDGLASFVPDGDTISWTSNATTGGNSQIFVADWDHQAALGLPDGSPLRAPDAAAAPESSSDEITTEDLKRTVAALTADKMAGGPAEQAGLASGDIVVGLAGQELENI